MTQLTFVVVVFYFHMNYEQLYNYQLFQVVTIIFKHHTALRRSLNPAPPKNLCLKKPYSYMYGLHIGCVQKCMHGKYCVFLFTYFLLHFFSTSFSYICFFFVHLFSIDEKKKKREKTFLFFNGCYRNSHSMFTHSFFSRV